MTETCAALTTSKTYWSFCPSLAAAYLFTILFGLTLITHLTQAILYRKAYTWVISIAGVWQTVAYIFRVLSILDPASFPDYAAWFILILVAPLWTNAFVYMVMGRMVWNFTSRGHVLRLKPWRFGMLFVVLDVIAFIVQVFGAGQASGNKALKDTVLKGLHIYMVGVGIQQGFILLFLVFTIAFHRAIRQEKDAPQKASVMLYSLYAVLILITIRIIFRLCEYAQGLTSTIPNHEVYQYCLDSLPMLLASVLLNVVHPGRIMPGKEADLPSRRERKRQGIRTKADREELSSFTSELVGV